MTNPTGTQWETALLNKLTSNGERIAVVEKEVKDVKQEVKDVKQIVTKLDERLINIESLLSWLKIIGGGVIAIALSLITNFIYSLVK